MARAVALVGSLTWHDEIAGEQQATPERFGDVVLCRKDAPASYHLAATLDELVDWDLLNDGPMRLSVGAVEVEAWADSLHSVFDSVVVA